MIKQILFFVGITISTVVIGQPTSTESPSLRAKKTLEGLSLEKKVAQLICVEIRGDAAASDPKVKQWTSLAKDHGIGGFVIYGGNAESAAALINKLQAVATIPILISTDFEGGAGQQFKGATEFPPNMAFAATRSGDLMSRAAQIMAREGRTIGVHLSYTPVVDIHVSPDNPQESGRSFGGDLALLTTMVKAYAGGYRKEGMLVTAKHFPGRGDMKGGPTYPSFTTLHKDSRQLDQQEFKAFSHAVAAGVDFVMTEHIAVPGATGGSTQPATVEPKLVKDILRNKLKFNGLITTDDLWYDHVVNKFGRDEVAVLALEAGHDIILKPKDPLTAMQAVVTAVRQGRIKQAQIDSSVHKLLTRKYALGLFENKLVDPEKVKSVVGADAHLKLAQEVADRSVTLLKNDGVLPLANTDGGKMVHITVQKSNDQANIKELKELMSSRFKGITQFSIAPDQDKKMYGDMLKAAAAADVVLISLFVQRDRHGDPAPLSREVAGLLDGMAGTIPGKVIAMSFGNPFLINKLPKLRCFLVGYGEGGFYGNQTIYFDSFARILKGELSPSGKLPVTVSDKFAIGYGLDYK